MLCRTMLMKLFLRIWTLSRFFIDSWIERSLHPKNGVNCSNFYHPIWFNLVKLFMVRLSPFSHLSSRLLVHFTLSNCYCLLWFGSTNNCLWFSSHQLRSFHYKTQIVQYHCQYTSLTAFIPYLTTSMSILSNTNRIIP